MIIPETLDRIASTAAELGELNEQSLAALRQAWPELRFTFCNDDDMPARLSPSLQHERFNVYLIGGGEHCLSLTKDPESAIGVVLAVVDQE